MKIATQPLWLVGFRPFLALAWLRGRSISLASFQSRHAANCSPNSWAR